MAVTYTRVPDGNDVWGRTKVQLLDITITGTYTAGGYTLSATQFQLKFFKSADIAGGDVSMGTYFPVFDFGTSPAGKEPATVKLRFFTASGVEATGAISPTINIRVVATGQ